MIYSIERIVPRKSKKNYSCRCIKIYKTTVAPQPIKLAKNIKYYLLYIYIIKVKINWIGNKHLPLKY